MFLFKNSSISLDISDFSLKACKLSKTGRDIYLDKVSKVKVPKGYIEKGRIIKQKEVADLIKQILRQVGGSGRKDNFVNTVLPDNDTFVKLVEVEKVKSEDQFIESIHKEIAHHIPYALEEVYLDWQKIATDSPKETLEQVLVGVCPKEIVDEYAKIFHLAGYIVKSFEIEALPITRSIFNLRKVTKNSLSNRNILVIDLGAVRSSLIFWREQSLNIDIVEFSVSLPISGTQINRLIEQKLQLSSEQAEKLKIKCGLSQGGNCKGVLLALLEPVLQDLIKRFKHAIHFHNSYFEGTTINQVMLCGGGASLKELKEFLAEQIGMPVSLADPLTNIKNKGLISKEDALSYCSVIGLGLKDFY